MKAFLKKTLPGFILLQLLWAPEAFATPVAYTDYDDFMAALPGPASVQEFWNPDVFDPNIGIINNGDTVDGITFSYRFNAGSDHI